jgi:hypothetical protein
MLKKISHYLKRSYQLGFTGIIKRGSFRMQKKIYKLYWKNKALKHQANHFWEYISKKHGLDKKFEVFWEGLRNRSIKPFDTILLRKITQRERLSLNNTPSNNKKLIIPKLHKITASRHPELVSGSTLVSMNNNRKWILKQVQDDDSVFIANNTIKTTPSQDDNLRSRTYPTSTNNYFQLLGSEKKCFTQILWHQDFKCKQIKKDWQHSFYQDIVPSISVFAKASTDKHPSLPKAYAVAKAMAHRSPGTQGERDKKNITFKTYLPDIKVPWELSRFQHILNLDAQTFYSQVNDWIDKNPYLIGVNWVCPMDVSIRAINFIYGFDKFKNSDLPVDFWKKFVCSLYDHAKYLENNWEIWQHTNNHYLSDLIGYFYLCFFFEDLTYFKKAKHKTYKKILHEFEKQIQPDGTSYEGSTSYHGLVTEIFYHFYLLCTNNNISLPKSFKEKLNKMFLFLDDCFDGNSLVQIGDNDSGRVVEGLSRSYGSIRPTFFKKMSGTHHERFCKYSDFGLTILKNKNWHITYRHPTYSKKQPSGHFHQDALSVTLSINNIPILVDPGSYLYTANPLWRNYFRSIKNHNTFWIQEDDLYNQDLFGLNIAEQKDTARIKEEDGFVEVEDFKMEGDCKLFRKLIFDNNTLIIKDWNSIKSVRTHSTQFHPFQGYTSLRANGQKQFPVRPEQSAKHEVERVRTADQPITHNLTLHPQIKLYQKTNSYWLIKHQEKVIATLKSNLNFKLQHGFYSPEYGKIERTKKLVATTPKMNQSKIIFRKS